MTTESFNSTQERADRTWQVLVHLSGLLWLTAIPFAHVLGPLVIWLMKKDGSPSMDAYAKEVLNFQITVTILTLVAIILTFVLVGIFGLLALAAWNIVMPIIGAVKASNGEFYRYPLTIRFIR